ncbi:MAG: hypothetical protein AB1631_12535 [Acidobacteriota bacterium]
MPRKITVIASLLVAFALIAIGQVKPDAALRATDEVLQSVSRIRGLEVKQTIKRGLKTRDEIESAVIRDLNESNTPEEFEASRKALIKLGLIQADFALRDYYIRLLREQVAGFYQPRTQEFYLAAWLPLSEQKIVIAHELVHALQDQHFNLRRFEKWPKGDSDAELAAHALIEGDATVVMYRYVFDQQGRSVDMRVLGALIDMLKNDSDPDAAKYPALAQAPAVLRESLQFPYAHGASFVHFVMKNRAMADLNNAYTRLPASSEQILHPDRYLMFDRPVKIETPNLSEREWKQIDADVNGEFGYQVLLAEFIDKGRARSAAAGWGGDRYALYENTRTAALMIVQYTAWDSEQDAKEFFNAYSERTRKRYKTDPAESSANRVVFNTAEGLVAIEMRSADVVIVEGAANRAELARAM